MSYSFLRSLKRQDGPKAVYFVLRAMRYEDVLNFGVNADRISGDVSPQIRGFRLR